MNLDAILEVAIGLVFAWLVLSVATMQTQEWISSALSWRSAFLEKSIRGLLKDDELTKRFYEHPLIKSLSQLDKNDKVKHKPSYIPSTTFSRALFDVIVNAGKPPEAAISTDSLSIAEVRDSITAFKQQNPKLAVSIDHIFPNFDQSTRSVEEAIATSRTNLEGWFNGAMDRLSGAYKRYATWWALILGLVFAFSFNVDTIQIADQLWREPTIREVLIAQAQTAQPQLDQTGAQSPLQLEKYYTSMSLPVGWSTSAPTEGQSCGWIPGRNVRPAIWSNNQCKILANLPAMNDGWGWLLKVLGVLISGAAAAQGAPFWFDMLKRLINLRGSGPAPQPTPPAPQPPSQPQPVG